MQNIERVFYRKATQPEHNSSNYKSDIISLTNLEPSIAEEQQKYHHKKVDSGKKCCVEKVGMDAVKIGHFQQKELFSSRLLTTHIQNLRKSMESEIPNSNPFASKKMWSSRWNET